MVRIALTSLGCRTNQVEIEAIRHALDPGGGEVRFVAWDEDADVYVINTCTVTSRADRQCRQRIHRAHRRSPDAAIVVTGCYAEADAATLAGLPGVVAVLGPGHRGEIGEQVRRAKAPRTDAPTVRTGGLDGPIRAHRVDRHPGRTRAPLKVQEGCDARCSYCIVPSVRGPSRSLAAAEVVHDARRLAAAGHPEIVLAGTHVGRWGRDLGPRQRVEDLVRTLLAEVPEVRLRLSSLDVAEVTPALVELLGREERVARHLHLTLQHLDGAVLARMGRPAPAGGLAARVRSLGESLPGFGLGADVIAGFPGEDEATFDRLLEAIEASPLTYLHAFGFSPRPGTPAADLPDQVAGPERRRRVAALRALADEQLGPRFAAAQSGRRTVVVVERAGGGDRAEGTTSEFATAVVEGGATAIGRAVSIVVHGAEGARVLGRIEGRNGSEGGVRAGAGC